MENKILKRVGLAGLVLFIATVLTGFIYASFNWAMFVRVCITAGLWYLNVIVLSIGVFWIVSNVSYERFPKPVFFTIQIVAAFIFAAIWTGMAFLDLKIYADPDIVSYLNGMYHQYFNIGVFVYAAVAGWLYMLQYHQRSKQQAVREADLKRLAKEAELRALKAQINPHFLFNALNSVNALMKENTEGARDMNARLANILRYALDGSESDFVTLRQEMDFVIDYIAIEKIRLGDKLQIEIDVDENLLDTKIPPMTLEPLVENAIKHGVADRTEGGTVAVNIEAQEGNLLCRVYDTGVGISSQENGTMLDRGVGLRNTLERLKRLYDDMFTFSIHNETPRGCTVTLSFPIEEISP